MIDLLIIADDLTGALDTAIQFSKRGIKTVVFLRPEVNWNAIAADTRVAVVHTDSRHKSPEQAYQVVQACVQSACAHKVPILFKKIDSALRGCIGAELQALADNGENEILSVLPSYPAGGRLCKDGIQYWNGVPITDTAYGKDPLEPVCTSSIQQILKEQTGYPVYLVHDGEGFVLRAGINIFDAQDTDTLRARCRELLRAPKPLLLAGCAGLADALAAELGWAAEKMPALPQSERLLLVCGSLHQVSRTQITHAQKMGYPLFTLQSMEQQTKMGEDIVNAFSCSPVVMLQTGADAGQISAEQGRACSLRVAAVAGAAYRCAAPMAIAVFGGDTLLAIAGSMFQDGLYPCAELAPGIPVSVARDHEGNQMLLISKSGGFGEENVIDQITAYLQIGKGSTNDG